MNKKKKKKLNTPVYLGQNYYPWVGTFYSHSFGSHSVGWLPPLVEPSFLYKSIFFKMSALKFIRTSLNSMVRTLVGWLPQNLIRCSHSAGWLPPPVNPTFAQVYSHIEKNGLCENPNKRSNVCPLYKTLSPLLNSMTAMK